MRGFRGKSPRLAAIISLICVLALLGPITEAAVGPVFDPIWEESEPIAKTPEFGLEDLPLIYAGSILPPLWHMKITGADLAKQEFDSASQNQVDVIVMDSGVHKGASSSIQTPARPFKTVTVRLPRFLKLMTGEKTAQQGKSFLENILSWVEHEAIDPREFKLQKLSPLETAHGTHVAGTVGADNTLMGVSPKATIIELDTTQFPIFTQTEDFERLFKNLANLDMEDYVLNASMTFPIAVQTSSYINQLMDEQNAILVMAAGNDGKRLRHNNRASIIPGLVTVGAFSPFGVLSHFSNFGLGLDIVAPGEQIMSRGPGFKIGGEEVIPLSGTSMAAPMVSGTFANLRSMLPEANQADLQNILYRTAWDLGQEAYDSYYGNGLLNTLKATMLAKHIERSSRGTAEDISEILHSDDIIFDFDEEARLSELLKNRETPFSKLWEEQLYRAALLSNDVSGLNSIAEELEPIYPLYADGLRHMGRNRPNNELSEEEVKESVDGILRLQAYMGIFGGQDNLQILENLANADLIEGVYEALKNKDWPESIEKHKDRELIVFTYNYLFSSGYISKVLIEKMTEVASRDRLSDFVIQTVEDTRESLESGPTEQTGTIL